MSNTNKRHNLLKRKPGELDKAEVDRLEKKILSDCDDLDSRSKLISHFFFKNTTLGSKLVGIYSTITGSPTDTKTHENHVLWMIENRPAAPESGHHTMVIFPDSNPEGYDKARQLWLTQITSYPDDPKILSNAISFLMIYDSGLSRKLLKEALEAHAEWSSDLNHLGVLLSGSETELRKYTFNWLNEQINRAAETGNEDLASALKSRKAKFEEEEAR
jgi:hypothetical protein